MKTALHSVALCLLLAACAGGSPAPAPAPAPSPATIADPIAYLVQSRLCDGNPATPLHQADPMTCRYFDFGSNGVPHYETLDASLAPDGSAVLAISFAPFGAFVPADNAGCPTAPCTGSGGDQYVVDGDTVYAPLTHDGSLPGNKYLTGHGCPGGTGWVMFKTDAGTDWKDLVAQLGLASVPGTCPAMVAAYTRYERGAVNFPVLGAVDTIVSEHYGGASVASAGAMERFFFPKGYPGLWQAWKTTPPPAGNDLSQRCPDFGWNAPPAPGWYLVNCRLPVNVEPADGTLTPAQEWHP
jgi:hypothetical protein